MTVEVLKPASGVAYLRSVNWKDCPFVCPEESVHGYQQCIYERVIPNYKGCQEENTRRGAYLTSGKIRTKPIQALLFMQKQESPKGDF